MAYGTPNITNTPPTPSKMGGGITRGFLGSKTNKKIQKNKIQSRETPIKTSKNSTIKIKKGFKFKPEFSFKFSQSPIQESFSTTAAKNASKESPSYSNPNPEVRDDNPNLARIELNKSIYGNFSFKKNIDTNFSELGITDTNRDINLFFNLYDELFYQIASTGERKSHQTLVERSNSYLGGFDDIKDKIIEDLTAQVEELSQKILELEGRPPISIDEETVQKLQELGDNIQSTVEETTESIEETIEDIEEDISEPMLDENGDGIDDTTQEFSNFGTPRKLIGSIGNDKADKALRNKNCEYYKSKYYGSPIYRYKKKVNKKKDRIVIYLGAQGKKGKRFLLDLNSGNKYKIKKKHWKGKNYKKLGKLD